MFIFYHASSYVTLIMLALSHLKYWFLTPKNICIQLIAYFILKCIIFAINCIFFIRQKNSKFNQKVFEFYIVYVFNMNINYKMILRLTL